MSTARDRAFRVSLGSLCQCFTTLLVRNFFLKAHLNLPSFNLKPFPLVLQFQPLPRHCLSWQGSWLLSGLCCPLSGMRPVPALPAWNVQQRLNVNTPLLPCSTDPSARGARWRLWRAPQFLALRDTSPEGLCRARPLAAGSRRLAEGSLPLAGAGPSCWADGGCQANADWTHLGQRDLQSRAAIVKRANGGRAVWARCFREEFLKTSRTKRLAADPRLCAPQRAGALQGLGSVCLAVRDAA